MARTAETQGLRTILNPANGPSESHQRLFGSCGSRSFHASACTARAEGPTALAGSLERTAACHAGAVAGRDPLGGVAEKIEQSERVGLSGAHGMRPRRRRCRCARRSHRAAPTTGPGRLLARFAACAPFRFGGQSIHASGLRRKPCAECFGRVARYADRGKARVAPAVVGRAVRLRWTRDGVRAGLFLRHVQTRAQTTSYMSHVTSVRPM